MEQICVAKANPIGQADKIDGCEIHIKNTLPTYKDIEILNDHFSDEAIDIMDALKTSLPQGTMHQLLILMLQNHRCSIVGNSKCD